MQTNKVSDVALLGFMIPDDGVVGEVMNKAPITKSLVGFIGCECRAIEASFRYNIFHTVYLMFVAKPGFSFFKTKGWLKTASLVFASLTHNIFHAIYLMFVAKPGFSFFKTKGWVGTASIMVASFRYNIFHIVQSVSGTVFGFIPWEAK